MEGRTGDRGKEAKIAYISLSDAQRSQSIRPLNSPAQEPIREEMVVTLPLMRYIPPYRL